MGINENILNYLSAYGREDKYKLARKLKTDVAKVTKALDFLQQEGTIEIKEGKAMLAKGKKPIIAKARKQEIQPTKESKENKEKKSKEEPIVEAEKKPEGQPKEEVSEEAPTHEEVRETFGQKAEEEIEERIEGTVKFYNPNKGFGFITGDNGKEYYVNESGLKEGVAIDSDDRVSFKVVQGPKGPKAEEVENLTQGGEQFRRTDQEHDQNVA